MLSIVIQPKASMSAGYDALGFISCTGTNFLVRSNALREVGGSPTYTLTEDYALGMALKMYGWHCRYVQARVLTQRHQC